jgi:hypothetical protein
MSDWADEIEQFIDRKMYILRDRLEQWFIKGNNEFPFVGIFVTEFDQSKMNKRKFNQSRSTNKFQLSSAQSNFVNDQQKVLISKKINNNERSENMCKKEGNKTEGVKLETKTPECQVEVNSKEQAILYEDRGIQTIKSDEDEKITQLTNMNDSMNHDLQNMKDSLQKMEGVNQSLTIKMRELNKNALEFDQKIGDEKYKWSYINEQNEKDIKILKMKITELRASKRVVPEDKVEEFKKTLSALSQCSLKDPDQMVKLLRHINIMVDSTSCRNILKVLISVIDS